MREEGGPSLSAMHPVGDTMRAWVLGNADELTLTTKPVPVPGRGEVLVHIDAVAICATDLEIISDGSPAMIEGAKPFNKNFTPGHEYMGTVAALGSGVDEYRVGERVTVEIHAGCGQCKRCRQGMYTSCLNYGKNTAPRTRAIAPTALRLMAALPNMPSITSTRSCACPTRCRMRKPRWSSPRARRCMV